MEKLLKRAVSLVLLSLLALVVNGQSPATNKKALAQGGVPFTERAFIQSVRKGDKSLVDLFLAAGMSPETRDANDRENSTVLMIAVMVGKRR